MSLIIASFDNVGLLFQRGFKIPKLNAIGLTPSSVAAKALSGINVPTINDRRACYPAPARHRFSFESSRRRSQLDSS